MNGIIPEIKQRESIMDRGPSGIKQDRPGNQGKAPESKRVRVLFVCGIILLSAEIYKQLFIYFVINGGVYDWWYFPFQLCSIPMYMCLLLPWVGDGRSKRAFCTFMQDYGILGGAAALAVHDGYTGIHWTITLHGTVWHLILIFIGAYIFSHKMSDMTDRGFADTVPCFMLLAAAAFLINLIAPGNGRAEMFYISPYHASQQPVFGRLAGIIGVIPSHILYLFSVCAGAYVIHRLLKHLGQQRHHWIEA